MAQLAARWALDRSIRVRSSGVTNCVEALSPHRVTAVGKLLTLNCLDGDLPSFTFILTLLSSDCGLSVVSNKRILFIYYIYYIGSIKLISNASPGHALPVNLSNFMLVRSSGQPVSASRVRGLQFDSWNKHASPTLTSVPSG